MITESDGIFIKDVQDRQIMDFHGNIVHQVGFGYQRVIDAMKAQLDKLPFCPRRYTNQVTKELTRRFARLVPGRLNKMLFTPGGTSAIGMAFTLARYATGRHKTTSTWDSFHGASLDSISICGESLFRKGVGQVLPGTENIPPITRENTTLIVQTKTILDVLITLSMFLKWRVMLWQLSPNRCVGQRFNCLQKPIDSGCEKFVTVTRFY